MLTGPVAFEFLQTIPRWHTEILQALGRVHLNELPEHASMEVAGKAPNRLAGEKALRIPVGEALDHRS